MNAIVLTDLSNGIGNEGRQIDVIASDRKRFQEMTMGHAVIMGRKTLESIGGPLPGRRNMVLSRDPLYEVEGAETFRSLPKLLSEAPEDAFVIGGGQIYELLLPYCDTIYETKVMHTFAADTWFPFLDPDVWESEESELFVEHCEPFRYITHKRRKKAMIDITVRQWAEECLSCQAPGEEDDGFGCPYCACRELCYLANPENSPWTWLEIADAGQ